MSLAQQLYAAGLGVFPCNSLKKPAIQKGTSWKDEALRDPTEHQWRTGIVGVPVPAGVVVVDLDTYKGVTREQVEQTFGASLDWDRALIQHTLQGGQHYAFACEWRCMFGSNMAGIKGMDTRTPGDGYIATGEGYTPVGFGLFAMTQPSALPTLPDACRTLLEHVEHTPVDRVELPEGDKDISTIRQALSHIDPGCERTAWVRVGLALRHHFHDDEPTGQSLFDEWSSGSMTASGEAPENYVPEDIPHQWGSFKAEGGVTVATLFYAAISQGWTPPAGIDTALAFGGGGASVDVFDELIDSITQNGGNPKSTSDLIASVQAVACNDLQRGILLATLSRELKEAGLLTKDVRKLLEGKKAPREQGQYGQNHTENAIMMLDLRYPEQTICRSQQVWYTYNGKAWEAQDDADIKHQVAVELVPSFPQHSTVSGTYYMMEALAHNPIKKIGDTPAGMVLMQNGVLELYTGKLHPHDKSYFTTNIRPYDYNPYASCKEWQGFLNEVFEGDCERIALLQEWLGYMMSSSYEHHKIMLLLGPRRCGKGTIGHIMKQLIGAQNFSAGTLVSFDDDAFIESLRTKTAMFIGDTAKNVPRSKIDQVIERMKGISGADDQYFRRKWKSSLTEHIPTRITLGANHVPRLFDDSGATAGRMLVLPMNVSWFGREDPELLGRLLTEIEGIAIWALQGYARLNQQKRFTQPAASQAETDDIAESFSPLHMFLNAACIIGGDNFVEAGDVYKAYQAWAVLNQEDHILARRTFVSSFKDLTRGQCRYAQQRTAPNTTPVRGFRGITLKENGSIPLTVVK